MSVYVVINSREFIKTIDGDKLSTIYSSLFESERELIDDAYAMAFDGDQVILDQESHKIYRKFKYG